MKNSVWLSLLVCVALALGSLALWAYPFSIKCPIDGEDMYFTHQVGYGRDAVCWYAHNYNDGTHTVKHEAYVPCPDR